MNLVSIVVSHCSFHCDLFPVDDDSWCRELSDSLVKCLRLTNDFQMVDHFHISLSRTFVMRHHWIDPMVESLRLELAAYPGQVLIWLC